MSATSSSGQMVFSGQKSPMPQCGQNTPVIGDAPVLIRGPRHRSPEDGVALRGHRHLDSQFELALLLDVDVAVPRSDIGAMEEEPVVAHGPNSPSDGCQ